MSPHRVRVYRVDDYRHPWRVRCGCGFYARWFYWRSAIGNADAHVHRRLLGTPIGGAA